VLYGGIAAATTTTAAAAALGRGHDLCFLLPLSLSPSAFMCYMCTKTVFFFFFFFCGLLFLRKLPKDGFV
jgi:hypothetical protein